MDNIKELQDKLGKILENDEAGFAEKIDQFKPEDAMASLSNYWNSSVQDFYNALKGIIPADWDNTDTEGHDAGYSFTKNPYVNPNVNKKEENYNDVRGNDKIVAVLKNKEHLDYTIGNDEIKQIADDIKEYMTRLLMPQYQRRVEVEDLNRDFWVIGQNLTALNEVILRIGNEFLNLLIAELCGLWDNIYRLWQALFYIEDSIEKMASGEKIRIMMEYGYGELEDKKNQPGIIFTKNNAYKYGILPYISKKKIDDNTYTAFVQYNKRLWNLPQDNIDLLNEYTDNSSLIKLEKKTNRKLLEVFNYIKSKNFVLFAKGNKDCFSSIISAEDPIATVLDFYRDFIVWVNNADKQEALNIIIKDTAVWKQAGYLKNIDFNTKNSATEITENIRNSFTIVKGLIANKHFNTDIFFDKVINCQSTAITQLISDISNPFDYLIKDFYNLFSDCQDLINFKGYEEDPAFNAPNSIYESPYKYTVPSEESIKDFNKQVAEYTKTNAFEKDKIFRMWTGKELPIVVWDLLSMSDSIQAGQSMNGFGGDYFCPYKGSSDHLWIDFVANIQTDSYNLTNANKEAGIGEKSTIGSITINDLMNDDKTQEKDTVYDVNISVPINKRKATKDDKSKNLLPAYHDFVRINKPYPKVTTIEANVRTVEDSIESGKLKNWNDLRHLYDLNNEDNWITYKDGKTYYCVDGFYAFNDNFTYSNITSSGEMKNIITVSNSKIMKNLLTYQISTSDMISCEHEEKGQSKVKNLYDFLDPVVNLRFINGKFNGQEIEIILTKDKITTPTAKIKPIVDSELTYIEIPLNTKLKTDDGLAEDEVGTVGVDCFGNGNTLYKKPGYEIDIANSNLDIDIYESYYNVDKLYYRQGCSIEESVDSGAKYDKKTGSWGSSEKLLTKKQAKEYINANITNDKIQMFLVTRQIKNNLRSEKEEGGEDNMAGLYLGYIVIYFPNITEPRIYPINRVITPVIYHKNSKEQNNTYSSKVGTTGNKLALWKRASKVLYMRDSGEGTFGHLHSFFPNGKDNTTDNTWIITAYGLLRSYNFDDYDNPSFEIDIILPDFCYSRRAPTTLYPYTDIQEYRKNISWDVLKTSTQVYGQIKLIVKDDELSELKFLWHDDSKFEYKEINEGGYKLNSGEMYGNNENQITVN
ncbi:MAG: hypothetical protein ACI4VU_06845 [Methanobrevibacter sp.]